MKCWAGAAALWLALACAAAAPAATPPPPTTYGALTQAQRIAVIEDLVARGELAQAQRFLSGSRFSENDLGYAAAFL